MHGTKTKDDYRDTKLFIQQTYGGNANTYLYARQQFCCPFVLSLLVALKYSLNREINSNITKISLPTISLSTGENA